MTDKERQVRKIMEEIKARKQKMRQFVTGPVGRRIILESQ